MLFQSSAHKTVCDQISLHLPRLSPHCHCLVASKEDSKTGTFDEKKRKNGQQRRFENSHSNSGLKEKSEGAVEMADSILRYFSQRLLSPLALLQS